MEDKIKQRLDEFNNFLEGLDRDEFGYEEIRDKTAAELLALFTQSVEESQWKKRFMELKKYLRFQENMVETHHAGRTDGDELVLLETINEHVEEIEESEY